VALVGQGVLVSDGAGFVELHSCERLAVCGCDALSAERAAGRPVGYRALARRECAAGRLLADGARLRPMPGRTERSHLDVVAAPACRWRRTRLPR
jgi:hypothetical protein